MNGFLMANEGVLLTKTSTALITLETQGISLRLLICRLKIKFENYLIRPLPGVDSLMTSTQARFIELHRTMSAFESRLSYCFAIFTFFLARQNGIYLNIWQNRVSLEWVYVRDNVRKPFDETVNALLMPLTC